MMYPRWANAPDTLSSGVRQQVGKMVYNRFENSKIEHMAEQVSRMRRQWDLYPATKMLLDLMQPTPYTVTTS